MIIQSSIIVRQITNVSFCGTDFSSLNFQVIQPNQITQAQLQQGLTWAPQFLQNLQNPIFIRGTQPDQQPMFIQQQQPLHNQTGSHQQFTMREFYKHFITIIAWVFVNQSKRCRILGTRVIPG